MTKIAAGLILSLLIDKRFLAARKKPTIVEKTQTIRLAPDLSQLSAGERAAVEKLIQVGQIFQQLYELQRHPQALSSYRELAQLSRRERGQRNTKPADALPSVPGPDRDDAR